MQFTLVTFACDYTIAIQFFKIKPEIVHLAVVLYVPFSLLPRNVQDLLYERGIEVSHKTVRSLRNLFHHMLAAELGKKRAQQLRTFSNWKWHMDNLFFGSEW